MNGPPHQHLCAATTYTHTQAFPALAQLCFSLPVLFSLPFLISELSKSPRRHTSAAGQQGAEEACCKWDDQLKSFFFKWNTLTWAMLRKIIFKSISLKCGSQYCHCQNIKSRCFVSKRDVESIDSSGDAVIDTKQSKTGRNHDIIAIAKSNKLIEWMQWMNAA